MRRGTLIVVIFIAAALVVVGISQFLRAQPPLELSLAVNPLAMAWARASVNAFNASEPVVNSTRRVRFEVVPVEDMDVWQDDDGVGWTSENHPTAWIPASRMSAGFARDVRFPFEVEAESVAQTPLVWGGFESRVSIITDGGARAFDWAAVADAAEAESWQALGGQSRWQFVKLGFDRPDRAVAGLAVLLSGAAAHANTAAITPAITNSPDFRGWFEAVARSVPNFNTLGSDPVATMASRGASVADIALQPESRWLTNLDGLARGEPVRLAYPQYPFVFDFPLLAWSDSTVTADEQQAVDALAAWLLSDSQQAATVAYGLRPASGEVPEDAPLFVNAAPFGAELAPEFAGVVQPLPRTETLRLLQWFTGLR